MVWYTSIISTLTLLIVANININESLALTRNKRFSKGHHKPSLYKRKGNRRVKANTDAPVAIYNPNFLVSGNTPKEKALYFIKHNLKLLHLDHLLIESSSEELDLMLHFRHVTTTRANPVWTTVRFEQIYHGVSVYESDIAITINSNDIVVMVMFEYKNGIKLNKKATKSPKQTDNDIITKALEELGYNEANKINIFEAPAMFVYHDEETEDSVLAWRMKFQDNESYKEYEILVDDEDGSVMFMMDKSVVLKNGNNIRNEDDERRSLSAKAINLRSEEPYSSQEQNQNKILQKSEGETEEFSIGNMIRRLRDTQSVDSESVFMSDSVEESLMDMMEAVGLQPERRLQDYCPPALIQLLLNFVPFLLPLISDFLENTFPCDEDSPEPPSSDPSQSPNAQPSDFPSVSPTISSAPTTTNKPSSIPSISNAPTEDQIFATVFNPDPITTSRGKYGDTGLEDDSDFNSNELNAQLIQVSLTNFLDITGSVLVLKGPYAELVDVEFPFYGPFVSARPSFTFTRDEDGFEAANCFYHISTYMKYIEEDLNITVSSSKYTGGVRFDPHGSNGEDNSQYLTNTETVSFGTGGVDDGEDAEVIIHRLGTLIYHWLTGHGAFNNAEGLTGGMSDYLVGSYARSFDYWTPEDDEYYRIFKWDGHNEFWAGRRLDSDGKYPDDLSNNREENGSIWSSCNMKVYDAIGRQKSDKAHLIGVSATSPTATQEDVANAIVFAAIDLGYSEADLTAMRSIYSSCGYVVNV